MEEDFMSLDRIPNRKSFKTLLSFSVFAVAMGLFASCQSSSPTKPQSGPEDWKFEFPDITFADTIKWVRGTDSGAAATSLTGTSTGTTPNRVATVHLSSPLGSGSVEISQWTLGIRTTRLTATATSGKLAYTAENYHRDSLSRALVAYFSARTKADTSIHFTRQGLIDVYAKALADSVADKFGFGGFPTKKPIGMDSAAVVKSGLVYLASKKSPLKGLIGSSYLGLDSATVRIQILVLISNKTISVSDSSSLFPPPPVRVKTPISLERDSLAIGGGRVGALGAFEADVTEGLGYIEAVVLDSNGKVDSGITIANIPQPNGNVLYIVDQKIYMVPESPRLGMHTLVVTALNGTRKFSAQSRKSFLVIPGLPKPDISGPAIELVDPNKVAVEVGTTTTSYLVKVKATDSSGVASVSIGDSAATLADGVWSRTVQLANYGQNEVQIKSLDKKGNSASTSLYISRKLPEGAAKPIVTLLNSKDSLKLPFEQKTLVLKWTVSDTAGIKSVDLNREPLTSKSDTFSAEVVVPATGDSVEFRLFVVNKNLIGTESVVKIIRAKDQIGPVVGIDSASWLAAGTLVADTLVVPTSSTSISLKWKATDNHYVRALTLDGDTLTKGADGLYVWDIKNLAAGLTKATVIASDSMGNKSFAYAKIMRMDRVTLNFSVDSNFVDFGIVKASSTTPGATVEYSLDGTSWSVVPEQGIRLSGSASIQFRGRAPGFSETVVTKNYVVKITPPPEAVGAVWNQFNWDDKLVVWQ